MNAKAELAKRLVTAVSGNEPVTDDTINTILKDYSIQRETEDERRDLQKRIWQYLSARRIDGLSSRTLKSYKSNLEMFAEKVTKPTAKITTDDIRAYITYLGQERHLADTTLQTHINSLRAFFGWLRVEEKIRKNPMNKIHSLKIDKRNARKALTAEEMERLRDACKDYREKALVEFLVSTGCRLSEVTGLQFDDLNFADRSVVVHGKGGQGPCCVFHRQSQLLPAGIPENAQGRDGAILQRQDPLPAVKTPGDTAAFTIHKREGRDHRTGPPPSAPAHLRYQSHQLRHGCGGPSEATGP